MKKDKKYKIISLILCIAMTFSLSCFSIVTGLKVTTFSASATNWLNASISTSELTKDADNDKYLDISSADDLAFLLQHIYTNKDSSYASKNFELTQNIDLGRYGYDWSPIPCFYGKFNGNGFTISNMNINYNAKNYAPSKENGTYNWGYRSCGLFAYVADIWVNGKVTGNAVVENIKFVNCTVSQSCKPERAVGLVVGVLGGIVRNCIIESGCSINTKECYVSGHEWNDLYFGGIAGYVREGGYSGAYIQNCFIKQTNSLYTNSTHIEMNNQGSKVTGSNTKCSSLWLGGIAGYATSNSTISLCYNNSAINDNASCAAPRVGGIAGKIHNSQITKCYNSGSINGGSSSANNACVGGIVGRVSGTSSVTYCYNTGNITGSAKSNGSETLANDLAYVVPGAGEFQCRALLTIRNSIAELEFSGGTHLQKADNIMIAGCYVTQLSNNINILSESFNLMFSNTYNHHETYMNIVNSVSGSYTANLTSWPSEYLYGQLCFKGGIVGRCDSNPDNNEIFTITYCYNLGNVNKSGSEVKKIQNLYYKVINVDENSGSFAVWKAGTTGFIPCTYDNPDDVYINLLIQNKLQFKQYLSSDIIGFYKGIQYSTNTLYSIRKTDGNYNDGTISFNYEQNYYTDGTNKNKKNDKAMAINGWNSSPTMSNGELFIDHENCSWWYLRSTDKGTYNTNFGVTVGNETNGARIITLYSQSLRVSKNFWGRWRVDSQGSQTPYFATTVSTKQNTSYFSTTTKTSLSSAFNSGSWAVDSKINDGYPYLKDFHWSHNTSTPASK